MRARILLAALSFLLMGCDDQKTTADRMSIEQANAQYDAEQKLMSELAKATPALEKRISDRISADNGLLFVVENSGESSFSLHALPASTPWHVSCTGQEIELTLGSWEEGNNRNAKLFTLQLSFARLSEDQCKPLAAVVARRMLALTTATRSP